MRNFITFDLESQGFSPSRYFFFQRAKYLAASLRLRNVFIYQTIVDERRRVLVVSPYKTKTRYWGSRELYLNT